MMDELELFAYYQAKTERPMCFGCCDLDRSGFTEGPTYMTLESIRESLLHLGETVAEAEVQMLVAISRKIGRKIFLCDDCWRCWPMRPGDRGRVLRMAWKYRDISQAMFDRRRERLSRLLFQRIERFHRPENGGRFSYQYLGKASWASHRWLTIGDLNGLKIL